jgi:hypothetical protein
MPNALRGPAWHLKDVTHLDGKGTLGKTTLKTSEDKVHSTVGEGHSLGLPLLFYLWPRIVSKLQGLPLLARRVMKTSPWAEALGGQVGRDPPQHEREGASTLQAEPFAVATRPPKAPTAPSSLDAAAAKHCPARAPSARPAAFSARAARPGRLGCVLHGAGLVKDTGALSRGSDSDVQSVQCSPF